MPKSVFSQTLPEKIPACCFARLSFQLVSAPCRAALIQTNCPNKIFSTQNENLVARLRWASIYRLFAGRSTTAIYKARQRRANILTSYARTLVIILPHLNLLYNFKIIFRHFQKQKFQNLLIFF